jgi:hypothetical protein
MMKCTVKLVWDDEAKVWYTKTDENLALCLNAGSFDVLVERVRMAAPEMLELNCGYSGPIDLIFEAVRMDSLEAALVS